MDTALTEGRDFLVYLLLPRSFASPSHGPDGVTVGARISMTIMLMVMMRLAERSEILREKITETPTTLPRHSLKMLNVAGQKGNESTRLPSGGNGLKKVYINN